MDEVERKMGKMESINRIDWNAIWNKAVSLRRPHARGPEQWDRKAEGFSRRARESEFVRKLIPLLSLQPDESLLDIGCGEGSVTIPLARQLKSVTAMDYSSNMLKLLKERAIREDVNNIITVQGSWYDPWDRFGIEEKSHDLVLASRSFLVEDLAMAVSKLNRTARKKVIAVTVAGEGPGSSHLLRVIGRPEHPAPDYIIALNYLRSLCIFAEVRFIELSNSEYIAKPDEALEWMKLSVEDLTQAEEDRLIQYLNANIVEIGGEKHFRSSRKVRWAVLSWIPPV